ncbi:MAG TPA: DUF4956 domain-containing protein [Candidatus Alectryocaccomicrobium excrementavium]|uniref:DUF4956 domain-containing protein n=1 Tax=Candidatus Alectryocaccomicrobium excrementavium TaxID=2840668 RepID=A0A9D1FYG2_9FIRM|nr:DUF4956 domain-containing protein [Clostridiales bacterium]HIS91816.1 DUF4956 domain-containing protein [Candidatus Alectryocaccomicrobium excrementavium]
MNKTDLAAIWQDQTISISSFPTVLVTLLIAFAVGVFIFWIYKMNFRGVMYSQNYALSLVLLCIITAPVVLCIRQSLALSLGMVGALSIVRFRTAVKDPLDTAYMFWSLTMGILIGAGQFFLAAVAVIGIALLITIISRVASKPAETFLLVLRGEAGVEGDVTNLLRRLKHMRLKSKTLSGDGVEITYEIRLERQHDVLINKLLSIPGVQDATLVSYANETL